MKVDYSVECALPYTEQLDVERDKFAVAFSGLARQFEEAGKQFTRVLLVDDVTNEAGGNYDLTAYTAASTNGNQETFVMRESMLNGLADEVYADLSSKLSADELAKLKSDEGYSSPFYIAVWTLLRLGYVAHPEFPADKVSEKIVNVLPESFREGEEESMEIVRKTQFPQAADQVEYVYIGEQE